MDFIDVAGLITFVMIGLSPVYILHLQRQREKSRWRRLAASTNLTYVPGKFLRSDAFIAGIYRGHRLKLETIKKGIGRGELYTIVMLIVDKSSKDGVSNYENSVEILTTDYALRGQINIDQNCDVIYYKQYEIENDETYLRSIFDLLGDIAKAYQTLVSLGGEVVPALQIAIADKDRKLRPVITQIIREISQDTTDRLEHRVSHLVCLRCLVRFQRHRVQNLSWLKTVTYYGCRRCHQSRDFFEGKTVAVLDNQMPTTQQQQDGLLWVNGLAHRSLFDFEMVHIVRATDEEVERFAVRVGNDTDPIRKPSYKKVQCLVSPDCRLTENTYRILRRMFGTVDAMSLASNSETRAF